MEGAMAADENKEANGTDTASMPTVCKLCGQSFDERRAFDVHECNGMLDVKAPSPSVADSEMDSSGSPRTIPSIC
jgi:hypothetical protein